jgi:membrane fusion protein (multidrug efflux system)
VNKHSKLNLYSSIIIAAFILLNGCGDTQEKKQSPSQQGGANRQMAIRADAFLVKKVTITDRINIPGTLVANETTDIHPESSGRITYLNLSEGKPVAKGTLIAKLYDGDLQATLNKLQVQLQIAEQNEERSAQLLKIQGISKQDYDASLLNVNNIKADIEITKAGITKTEIRAPFSGKLGLKMVSSGAFVTPSTTLTSITQLDQMRIDFTVPEKYSPQIKTGQPLSFTVEGSDKTYIAKVIATESNVTEDTRSLLVRAAVQGNQSDLIPGKFAKVSLGFQPDPNAIVVPSQAIIPQARGKKVYLYSDGTAKFIDVTTGVRDSANVQIVSGLKSGDTVLVTGLLSMRPDSKVTLGKIINAPSSEEDNKNGEAKKQKK